MSDTDQQIETMANAEGNGKGTKLDWNEGRMRWEVVQVSATLPHGAFTRIAKRLRPKVSPSHVRKVWLGERESPRVSRAIERYLASLESKAA